MYICTEAAQKTFIPIHGEMIKNLGNFTFNIPGGAMRFSTVTKAAVVTLISPFHFITGIYSVARKLIEQ